MASSTKAAGAGANSNDGGNVAWTNPGNITANDGTNSITATSSGSGTSQLLLADAFGFAIPAGASIDGIIVSIDREESALSADAFDHTIRLLKAGTAVGDNKADTGTEWPVGDGAATYGGATDLWGTTWTVDDVNHADFGVLIKASIGLMSRTAQVDYVEITVHYTEGGAPAFTSRLALLGVG